MPLFEYKGTSKGSSVTGTLEAESHQAATKALNTRDIKVVLLRPLPMGANRTPKMTAPVSPSRGTEGGVKPVSPSRGTEGVVKAGAASPSPTVPRMPPSESRLASLVSSLAESNITRNVLLGVVTVAVIAGALGVYRYSTPWGLARLKKGETPRVLEIKGRVTFEKPPENGWQNVEVTFVLPEVPAQSRRGASELSFNAVGDYTYKLHYLSEAPPTTVHVIPSCRGYMADQTLGRKIIQDGPSALVAVQEIKLHPVRGQRGAPQQTRAGQETRHPGKPRLAPTPAPAVAPEPPTPETGPPPASEQ